VVIVGGGFAGLNAAKGLSGASAFVILLERNNFHLFPPLLYQVATAALSPAPPGGGFSQEFRCVWIYRLDVVVIGPSLVADRLSQARVCLFSWLAVVFFILRKPVLLPASLRFACRTTQAEK
jgi:2-polyprenyl-6-methoxyphenol hydroxylase-like FAD-dependent oxidoreductase